MVAVFAQASGNVFLSKGMKSIFATPMAEGLSLSTALQAAGSPSIWLGIVLSILFFILFMTALSWADLSLVLPGISAEVIVNVAFANYFLMEPVSPARWAGTLFVAIGVILVLRSGRKPDKLCRMEKKPPDRPCR